MLWRNLYTCIVLGTWCPGSLEMDALACDVLTTTGSEYLPPDGFKLHSGRFFFVVYFD